MNQTKHATLLLSSFLLVMSFSSVSFGDSVDPDYASTQCARQKGDIRACCDDMLEGVKSEVKECIQLTTEKRKQAKDAKAAKAAAKKEKNDTGGSNPETFIAESTGASKLTGTWSIEFGDTMVVSQGTPEFKARFNFKDGRIIGTVNDNTMTGVWVQSSSKSKCSEKKDGSYYWGEIKLVFSGNSYTGVWGYCEEEPNRIMRPGERKR